jgi:hypothetical protein
VSHGLLGGAVETGALENNVNVVSSPRAVSSVLLSRDLDGLTIDSDGAGLVIRGYGVTVVATLSGVVLEQVSEHGGLGQVVDSNDLVTLSAEHLTESQTADTAKAINSNFYRHGKNPPFYMIFFVYPGIVESFTFPFLFIIMQIAILYKTFEENLSILYT